MNYKNKITAISVLLFILLVFVFYKFGLLTTEKFLHQDIQSCKTEDTLSFEGIVTDYSGHGMKTTPVLILLDGKPVSIPRYNSSFDLWVGDSLKKIKGAHFYMVKHNNRTGKIYDTVYFQCP